jgi:hypothetical protein
MIDALTSAIEFDVDRDTVRVQPGLVDEFGIGVGDRLEVDVSAEMMVLAQRPRDLDHLLHRVVRRCDDARGEEQALDIIAFVEGDGEIDDFLRREAGAADVRAFAVDAVMAVEDAAVGQQDLQQRDAAAVGRIGVADAHAFGRAEPLAVLRIALGRARRCARCVVFGCIGENLELFTGVELGHSFVLRSAKRGVE